MEALDFLLLPALQEGMPGPECLSSPFIQWGVPSSCKTPPFPPLSRESQARRFSTRASARSIPFLPDCRWRVAPEPVCAAFCWRRRRALSIQLPSYSLPFERFCAIFFRSHKRFNLVFFPSQSDLFDFFLDPECRLKIPLRPPLMLTASDVLDGTFTNKHPLYRNSFYSES